MMTGDAMGAVVHANNDPASSFPLYENSNHQGVVEKLAVVDGVGTGIKVGEQYLDADGDSHIGREGDEWPTEEDLVTLRRVPDKIPWTAYTVALVELCERFSYYGTQVVFQNFIQRPLPKGSTTGASGAHGQSGALGMGQRAGTAIGTFNQFWNYTTPLFGAYLADAHWGRYKTICIVLAVAILAHILFIIAALPPVIAHTGGSLGTFILGVIVLGIGTGGLKPNIAPLVIEQLPLTKLVVRKLPSGERIIHDPALTANRVYMYYFMFVNVGALVGQLTMTYTEKYVGFWLAWTLPTLVYCICPVIMVWGRNKYKRIPPEGSVLIQALRIWTHAQKGRWSLNPISTWKRLHDGTMWESVKPSKIGLSQRPSWMTFDDQWVDEVRRGFAACAVFAWYPLFWICYNQINNNLISQAALMELNGLPNDVISNITPLTLIVLIPFFDQVLYPIFRHYKINFTPIKRITAGFYCGCAAMIWAAVLQHYIYIKSPCGYSASTCADKNGVPVVAPINIGAQIGAFVLIAISEIFGFVTSLEYAYSKAPKNMRSLVQAVVLFTNAIAAAIGEALVPLAADPLLVWNYTVPAILAFVGGTIFWIQFRELDADEDKLNMLPEGRLIMRKGPPSVGDERAMQAIEKDDEEKRMH